MDTQIEDIAPGVHTLPNGLRLLHEPVRSRVAYCGFAIDAGTVSVNSVCPASRSQPLLTRP